MDSTMVVSYQRPASRITVLAHFFGVLALILLLVWLLHYRGGLNYNSDNPYRVFNVHPFLMFFGFIFFAGEAVMAYKTVAADMDAKKFLHMLLNLTAMVLGIVGLCATFKYHDMLHIKHMTSLHSWMGMGTFCLFGLQWLFGFSYFLFPKASPSARVRALPWHICGGRALLYMAIITAETGLMQSETLLRLGHNNESRVLNFTGLLILLFGVTVDLTVALARYA